jgi:uncharacterized protein
MANVQRRTSEGLGAGRAPVSGARRSLSRGDPGAPVDDRNEATLPPPAFVLATLRHGVHHHSIMQAVTDRLRNFLQFVAVKLIDEPAKAQLKVAELSPKRLRFKLVLAQADVAMLIGRNGFTASAIRNVLKAAAEREGVQVTLQIHSHEEEAELLAREAHP